MSSFRPGPVPSGVEVTRPVWPTFTPGQQPVVPSQAEVSWPPAYVPPAPDPHEGVIANARLEASRILQEASDEAARALTQVQEEGFEHGRQEGMAAGKAELESMRQQAARELESARVQAESIRQVAEANAKVLQAEAESQAQAIVAAARDEARRILDGAQAEAQQRLDASQAALVQLAAAAAVRLVQGHLAIQPQAIVQMVATGLRRLKDAQCTVRVNPEDLPLLEAQRSTLERELGAGLLTLSPDQNLQRGSYLVSSPQGQVDGTLERQSELIQAALQAALGGK